MLFFIIGVLTVSLFLVLAAGRQYPAPEAGSPFFFCNAENDSDMKIAGLSPPEGQEDDLLEDEGELARQKTLGNIEKARWLGAEFAARVVDGECDPAFGHGAAMDEQLKRERRILLAFSVNYAVDRAIPSRLLAGVVRRSFYDCLKKDTPAFYSDLSGSGSFSFYYLCIRRGGPSVEDCIGQSFAMLAGKENDPAVSGLGKALFLHFTKMADSAIASAGFAE